MQVLLHISSTRTMRHPHTPSISTLVLRELDQVLQDLYHQHRSSLTMEGTYFKVRHTGDMFLSDHLAVMIYLESARVNGSSDLDVSVLTS
jgi:hypothetical protein